MNVDFNTVVAADKLSFDDPEEQDLVREMIDEAHEYVRSFRWVSDIAEMYVGLAVGGVILVALVQIDPAQESVDEWIWVIVGDLPPAYLTVENARTPLEALDSYMGEMAEWVKAVRAGKPVEDLIPVNAPPTDEYADMLDQRLKFLDQHFLSANEGDLPD